MVFLKILGITFNRFDDLYKFFNHLWLLQISLSIFACIRAKRYFPDQTALNNILIKQFYFYLLLKSILYASEIYVSSLFFVNFELFSHHTISIFLFWTTYLEPQMISVLYLIPYFFHSIYWFIDNRFTDFVLLFLYNLSLFFVCFIIFYIKYNRSVKVFSFRIVLFSGLLFHSNALAYFYNYNINFYTLDTSKFFRSLLISTLISFPYYFYIIYCNCNLDKNYKKFLNSFFNSKTKVNKRIIVYSTFFNKY